MKYTAINIGPIVGTLALARRPRELWSASYLFSFLMECIIGKLVEISTEDKTKSIISPATIDKVKEPYKEVGLYPDRVFTKGFTEGEIKTVVDGALEAFNGKTDIDREYVNVMYITIDKDSDQGVVKELNYHLDCMELTNRPFAYKSYQDVLALIQKKMIRNYTNLFPIRTGLCLSWHRSLPLNFLLWKGLKSAQWELFVSEEREKEGKKINPSTAEDEFYQKIKSTFKEEYCSFYKYVCVVQADGDNMGKIVSALDTDKVEDLSETLLEYGSSASKLIKDYGGLPIYAGGDDLLFIAPVVSGKFETVFGLIEEIDKLYVKVNEKVGELWKDESQGLIQTTMSYGLSISYYKYPLYEALEAARDLLFGKAKHITGKNAIAWCLRKHSGSGFEGAFTKTSTPGTDCVYGLFKELMKEKYKVDNELVSAIAHKLCANSELLEVLRNKKDKERISAFYKNIMEEKEPQKDDTYEGITRRLLIALLFDENKKSATIEEIFTTLYGMLRTAKFINGEGDSDE